MFLMEKKEHSIYGRRSKRIQSMYTGHLNWKEKRLVTRNLVKNIILLEPHGFTPNYGHNFYNSITRFAKEGRDSITVTTEQTGTPTNALRFSERLFLNIISI